jgi:uncharacterized protein DUF2793
MSDPILPLAVWASGTNQNSIPANDNALRVESLSRPCLGVANDAAGGDAEGDVWIVGSAPTGAFATFDEDDIAIFDGTGWKAWAPVEGLPLIVNDVRKVYDSGAWINDPSISGGGGSDRSTVTSVSSASGVVTLDWSLGDYFTLTLTENVTSWVISNPPGSGHGFTLMVQITQDSTPRTVAKPGTTAGGAGLGVSTGSGDIDLLAITSFNNGTTLRSSIAKDFS